MVVRRIEIHVIVFVEHDRLALIIDLLAALIDHPPERRPHLGGCSGAAG